MPGVGVDVLLLSRVREAVARSGEVFLARVFTPAERDRAAASRDPARHYATAFAVKEAVFKALDSAWQEGADFRDLEVGRGARGEPTVAWRGSRAAGAGGPALQVSLSYDGDTVVALALRWD
ncbi:MAG: holo-ACP synthase [Deltaproteobacteria bacterium]|nr:holo-ACP synthase [Deltaproteobacteria bacterium]